MSYSTMSSRKWIIYCLPYAHWHPMVVHMMRHWRPATVHEEEVKILGDVGGGEGWKVGVDHGVGNSAFELGR